MRSSRPTKRGKVSVQGPARKVPVSHSLAAVVGDDVYGVWVAMLGRVGPAGRTHRLAVVIAAMLQHAALVASEARARRRGRDPGADHELLIARVIVLWERWSPAVSNHCRCATDAPRAANFPRNCATPSPRLERDPTDPASGTVLPFLRR